MKPILFSFFLFLAPVFLYAQDELDDKPLTKNQEKRAAVLLQIDAATIALLAADSLFDNGAEMIKESKNNMKMIAADKKEYLENYKIKYKEIQKQVTGDDKAAAAKKASDLKEMENEKKLKLKNFETDNKVNLKNLALGEKLMAKGESKKDAAKEKLKILNENLKATENNPE